MELSLKRREYYSSEKFNHVTCSFIKQFFPEAWHGEISAIEAEKKLDGQKVGVYLFREESSRVYLAGINHLGHVEHVEFVNENEFWLAFQGGDYIAKHPNDLIHQSLHCEEAQCAPLC